MLVRNDTIENEKVELAILSAMPEELVDLEHYLGFYDEGMRISSQGLNFTIYKYQKIKILIACTGIGTTFAASVFTLIHERFRPDYFLFTGTAGGLSSACKIRDVVLAESAYEAEMQDVFSTVINTPFASCLKNALNNLDIPAIYSAHREMLEMINTIDFSANNITVHQGKIVSSNAFPTPIELFAKIKMAKPLAIDMETSAIYQAAWLLDAKALAVRGISNLINQQGADDKIHESDIEGSSKAANQILVIILDTIISMKFEKKS